MKKLTAAVLAALLLLSVSGCDRTAPQSPAQEPPAAETPEAPSAAAPEEMPSALPATKYALSESGECIVDDVTFRSDYRTDDNRRVFYEIFVGSFSDSNGDGTGDLRGIIDRFDYLNDGDPCSGLSLGVEGIWLTPVFKSNSYHKYDVNDYYTIDPKFGTMDDLEELIALCRSRNVKLIIDLPINHTGVMHDWFQAFRTAHQQKDTESPYYDWYCWYGPGESAPSGRTFSGIMMTDDYYECNFSGSMPELNFDNEAVRRAVLDVALYYLDLGIDGFRFDAAKYVYFGDHAASESFWEWYTDELRAQYPDVYIVGEVWDGDGITELYTPSMNCFNFTVSGASGLIAETAKAGNVNRFSAYTEKYIGELEARRSDAFPVWFLANHDTDRAAGYLGQFNGQLMTAANLYLLSPGSSFIYYGEEIGMKGSRGGASTDANRRLAMLWGDGDTVKDPEGTTYPKENQTESSVLLQLGDETSAYNYYKRAIMIRTANPEIARGKYHALSLSDKLSGFVSTWNGSSVCVLHNTTLRDISLDLAAEGLSDFALLSAVLGLGGASLEGTVLTVSAQTSVVLR